MTDWTIYTLGDLPMFNQVLNAVAIVFKPATGIFAGTGVFGFGGAIVVGLLISLIMVLANTMVAQASGGGSKFNLASLLMVAIILYAFLIPSRVILEDIHTGRNSVIDNIPVGVAVPASLISTLTRRVSEKFETAFSTVDGNYISMGQQGFVNPIQLLASLRGAVFAADQAFTQSFLMAYRDCAVWQVNPEELKKHPDPFGYATAKMTVNNGLTMYYGKQGSPYENGVPVSCARASIQLRTDLASLLVNSPTNSAMTNLARQGSVGLPMGAPPSGSPASAFQLSGSRFGRAPTVQDMNVASGLIRPTPPTTPGNPAPDAFFATPSGQALFTSPLIRVAEKCANSGIDAKTYSDCATVMVDDATRMYTARLAGESSVFTKMVIPSMNMLMAMFFAFAPIVVLVVAVSGPSGIGILGKYLLFGVWTQSWLPMASIINYLIQISLSNDVAGIVAGTNIDLSNTPGIYDALDRKLTVAFSMLASVPFISMAVLSGSFYSMTKVADKMTGGGQGGSMDTKMAERASFANAPMIANQSTFTGNSGTGMLRTGMAEMSLSASAGGSQAFSQETSRQKQLTASESEKATIANTEQVARSVNSTNSAALAKSAEKYLGGDFTKTKSDLEAYGKSVGFTNTQSEKFQAAVMTHAGARMAASGGKGLASITKEDIAAGAAAVAGPLGTASQVLGVAAGGAAATGVLAPAAPFLGAAAAATGGASLLASGVASGLSPPGQIPVGGGMPNIPGNGSPGQVMTPPKGGAKGKAPVRQSTTKGGIDLGGDTGVKTSVGVTSENSQQIADQLTRQLGVTNTTADKFSKGWKSAVTATFGTTNQDGLGKTWGKSESEAFERNNQFVESASQADKRTDQLMQQAGIGLDMKPSQVTQQLASRGLQSAPVDAVNKLGGAVESQYKDFLQINGRNYKSPGADESAAAVMALAAATSRGDLKAAAAFGQVVADSTGYRISGTNNVSGPAGDVAADIAAGQSRLDGSTSSIAAPGVVSSTVQDKTNAAGKAITPTTANQTSNVQPNVLAGEGNKAVISNQRTQANAGIAANNAWEKTNSTSGGDHAPLPTATNKGNTGRAAAATPTVLVEGGTLAAKATGETFAAGAKAVTDAVGNILK